MAITTISNKEFSKNTSRAMKASSKGPVFITDQGRPTYVVLNIEEYQRLCNQKQNLVDILSMPGLSGGKFDPQLSRALPRAADFS